MGLTATATGVLPALTVVVTVCAGAGTALTSSTAHAKRATDSQTRSRRIMESPFNRDNRGVLPQKDPLTRIRNCENSRSTEEIVNGRQKTTRGTKKFIAA